MIFKRCKHSSAQRSERPGEQGDRGERTPGGTAMASHQGSAAIRDYHPKATCVPLRRISLGKSRTSHTLRVRFLAVSCKGIIPCARSQGARSQLVLQERGGFLRRARHSRGMRFPNLSSELRIIAFARQITDLVLCPCPGLCVQLLLECNEKEN